MTFVFGSKDDSRVYKYQSCTGLLRSSKDSKDGLLQVATDVAKRLGFVWKCMARGFHSRRRTKIKQDLKACKRVRHLGYKDVLARYAKDVNYAKRMDQPLSFRPTARRDREKYTPWILATVAPARRQTCPHHWNNPDVNFHGEVDASSARCDPRSTQGHGHGHHTNGRPTAGGVDHLRHARRLCFFRNEQDRRRAFATKRPGGADTICAILAYMCPCR